ncbi:MAG TPA: hypothetical protein VJT74_02830 [Pyrinomonadaceae bacterium]|nr:hypothetical protein [Pyrinomonadaceae bacterium]
MNPSAHEEEIDLTELVVRPAVPTVEAPPTAPAPAPVAEPEPPGPLESHISALTERIQAPLGKKLQHILTELSRLIKYLQLIEQQVLEETTPQKVLVIFRAVHERANILTKFVNVTAASVGEGGNNLYDVLNGISFGLRHELHRVYEDGGASLVGPDDAALTRARAVRAHGLLQNCFQQLIITLLQALDPGLDASALFEDFKIKRKQSITLYGELTGLLGKVRKAQHDFGLLQNISLANLLGQFRQDTMHYLMYQDWAEFEGFIAEIVATHDDADGFAEVLRRFTAYLETLISQVAMRTVLKG